MEIKSKILSFAFSYDSSLLAIGTEIGFLICKCEPFKILIKRDLEGGIGHIEILGKSNILILTGGGQNPRFQKKKIIIYDDFNNKILAELKFSYEIKNIKINSFHLFVITEKKIYVYDTDSLNPLETIDTCLNSKGLLGISLYKEDTIISYLSKYEDNIITVGIKYYKTNKTKEIKTMFNSISGMALNSQGDLLCLTSGEGKNIKVFSIETDEIKYEFTRGSYEAEEIFINFNMDSRFLALTSNKGTLHIFSLHNHSEQSLINNLKKKVFSWFSQERCFAQYYVGGIKSSCSFKLNKEEDKIFVITSSNKFFIIEIKSIEGENHEIGEVKSYNLEEYI